MSLRDWQGLDYWLSSLPSKHLLLSKSLHVPSFSTSDKWDSYGLKMPRICSVFNWNGTHNVHQPLVQSLLLTIPPFLLHALHGHLLEHTPSTCSAYLITRTSSWKAWSTFILIFADASIYVTLSCRANCCPSSCVTWNGLCLRHSISNPVGHIYAWLHTYVATAPPGVQADLSK